jgi:glycosyltransferase involved in cell wall biosynthesis
MSDANYDRGQAIHVGVNAHLLSLSTTYRSAGISWYIYHLLQHLPAVDAAITYTVFLSGGSFRGDDVARQRLSRLPTHRPAVRILWEQAIQPWAVRQAGVDLVHAMAFVGPLLSSRPAIITIHDLSFLYYPQGFQRWNRFYLRLFTRWSVRRAQRVIAVSGSTKLDVVQAYGFPASGVDVVYHGVDAAFRPLPAAQVAAFRQKQGLPERFLLFVGTLEPRKNVARLIEAYARLPAGRPPLMLVGGKGWLYDEVLARVEALGLGDDVHLVGYVPAGDLPLWYNAAQIFVYPSLYEGFGLPPLEAMACGTPVVTSCTSSLPEVVGQAARLVDPTDIEALAAAIEDLLQDRTQREQLQAAGLKQAQQFTWAEAAQGTVSSYRLALSVGRGERHV